MDELFADAQEVVFLMGSFLNDVEEGVLHHNLCDIQEFLVQEHPLMIRVVPLVIVLVLLFFDLNRDKRTCEPMPMGGDELIISTRGVYSVSNLETSY